MYSEYDNHKIWKVHHHNMYFKLALLGFLLFGWTNLAIVILCFNVVVIIFGKRIFANICSKFGEDYNVRSDAFKKELFKELNDMNPEEKIRILEIGGGSGTNFKYWNREATVEIVEPNPHFVKYFDANRAKFPQLDIRDMKQGFGEDLTTAGIASNSVDAVVITLVLCSVQNQKQCLKEIHRVLKPGGKFFYMEHIVAGEEAPATRIIQKALMVGGFWPFLGGGCCTDRATDQIISAGEFSAVNQRKYDLPVPKDAKIMLKVCGFVFKPHVMGVATK